MHELYNVLNKVATNHIMGRLDLIRSLIQSISRNSFLKFSLAQLKRF